MKLRIALLVVGLPLLALGAEGLYYRLPSGAPVATTCDRFVRERPRQAWVRLSGCAVDYALPGYRETGGRVVEIFFPVRPAGQSGGPAPVLAASDDPGALALLQNSLSSGRPLDPRALAATMQRSRQSPDAIEGVVRAGVFERLQTRRALRSFPVPLESGYRVIDLGTKPALTVPALESGIGLLSIVLFVLAGRTRERSAAPVATATGEVFATPADALPTLLLLNLDAAAGVEAIEHAPPLGPRDETIETLRRALGYIRLDDKGCAYILRDDVTMEVPVGLEEPVWIATLRASGPGAQHAVRALAAATGWRVFAPRRGDFVDGVKPVVQPVEP